MSKPWRRCHSDEPRDSEQMLGATEIEAALAYRELMLEEWGRAPAYVSVSCSLRACCGDCWTRVTFVAPPPARPSLGEPTHSPTDVPS